MASSTKPKARRRMGRRRREPDTSVYSGRVAARLRMLRERKGKTVEEFRDRLANFGLDISLYTLYKWEAGESHIPPDHYPIIAEALDLTVRGFLPPE